MSSTVTRLVVSPVPPATQATDAATEKMPSQKYVHRAFLLGLAVGFLQMTLSGLALGVVLDLLRRGTLVTPESILVPMGCLAVSVLALGSMLGLRKHQRFRAWLPATCYFAGMGLCAAMVLLEKTAYLGPGGLRGFMLQPGAHLPGGGPTGYLEPLTLAPLAVAAAGALGSLPFLSIFALYLHPESRRLLRWMKMH
jgi:hypothetical protein